MLIAGVHMRFFLVTFTSLVFVMMGVVACAQGDETIDPHREITVGAVDAPNELTYFFSPGCPSCLRIIDEHFNYLVRSYVDDGRLKITFHLMPMFVPPVPATDEETGAAIGYSTTLGINLLCRFDAEGIRGFASSLASLIDAHQALPPEQQDVFPVLPVETLQQEIGAHLVETGALIPSEFQACMADDVRVGFELEFAETWKEYTTDWSGRGVPAMYLNGQAVRLISHSEDFPVDVRGFLQEAIGDPAQ